MRKDTPTQLQLFEELFRIAQGQGEAEKTEKISSGGQSSGATVKITSGTDTAGSGKTEVRRLIPRVMIRRFSLASRKNHQRRLRKLQTPYP